MKQVLLDAGAHVAAERGLSRLSLNLVAAEAGVAKGSLLHHFGTREAYLVALHRRWHDCTYDEIVSAAADLPAGRQRLLVAANRYLDICRRDRGVRAVLFQARCEPVLAGQVAERNRAFAAWARADFEAMGYRDPEMAARLFLGAVVEAATLEHRAGRRQPRVRQGLEDLVADR
jgi:TetR/AcrR family transcriptional repressor of nem operon